ncbi:MAG: glycosyltransferase [Candidatus Omnitrophica bacterium]|nr:glycosyltransferase [Candidatus Omnitrophota bacterium]
MSINLKLDNVFSLEYPQDKFEVIVASDCSTDRTDDIVRMNCQKSVLLCRSEKRGGKVAAYKNALGIAKGDIVVFSDATSILEKNSLINLVRNFNDSKVGCVAGLLTYEDPQTVNVGKGEHGYWQYNRNINMLEGLLDSMTSVSGTFFAVRKELYPLNMESHLAEDLVVPLNVRRNGFVTIMEPEALCFESTVQTQNQEIRKRSRITIQNLHGLLANLDMFNLFKYGLFSVFLISHKLFRSLSALFLLGIFILNVFLLRYSNIYVLTLIGQIVFYSLGIIGGMWRKNRPKIINAVYFFCLSNYSILIGFFMFLIGYKVVTWDTERQEL